MASIAYGEPVAAVDGNVMRVLARLRCLEWDVKEPKRFQGLGQLLLDPGRAGDFNQVRTWEADSNSLINKHICI